MRILTTLLLVVMLGYNTRAQIPFEVMAGNEKASLDMMFFRYFKNKDGNSPWLFFNRNRVVADYRMTKTSNLPSFGFTGAISYNHPKLKGLAPVAVAQVFSNRTMGKAGVQFARMSENYLLFTWWVVELDQSPDIDWFVLARYTPLISGELRFFSQFEVLATLNTENRNIFTSSQRIRLGVKKSSIALGLAGDLQSKTQSKYPTASNAGVFVRYEF